MPQYDSIGPTPRNALLGLIADYLGKANGYAQRSDRSMPMGKSNPVLSLLADGVGLGDVAATADRASYGLPLTSGTGQTTQMLPETRNALMAVAPMVAKNPVAAGKAAMGLMGGGADAGMAADRAALNVALYGIEHRPMTDAGGASRLHDLTGSFGPDVYGPNALQYFGSGDAREKAVLQAIRQVRGKPDSMVTIYRGVPDDVNTINRGDWVTLSPQAAADYGRVVSMKVPASHVTSWPDSLLEFGYYPPEPK
jgi:hypothetical protein